MTGPDGNRQSLEASVSPEALHTKTASPVALSVEVKTGTTAAKLAYRGAFTYGDSTTIDASTTQACTPKPEPKKK